MSKKILLSLCSIASVISVHAQTSDTTATSVLDDVIVTANKIPQKQSTTGKVVTVITKEQIEKSAGKTVAQLLNEQAGLVVNGAFNAPGAVQTVYMRGANAGRTLILLDGIPLNDPSTITTDFDLNFFSLNDVERIEICKGAQSTLYGSDAIAGAINIITVKKDVKEPFNIKATMAFGNLNTTKNNLQVFGRKDKLAYSARFAKLRTNSFSSAYDSTGNKSFDYDGYNGDATNATLQYQATNKLSLKAFALYSQYKADIDAANFTDKRNYFINNKSFTTGTGFNYKAGIVSVTGNYQYNMLRRLYDDNASVPGATSYSTNTYFGMSNFAELYASLKVHKAITLLVGTDYRYNNMSGSYFSSSFGASPYKDTSMQQQSVYGSAIFSALDNRLNIELGGRYNKHSRYGDNSTYTFNPSYAFSKGLRVFGSIASGFKTPGLYQLYDKFSGNLDLQPEKSVNYEAGVQQQYKKIDHRLVYFYREIENGIDYNYVSFKYFNFIKQTVRGIEYEVNVKPVDPLSITANFTYLNGDERTQSRVNFKDTSYQYLLRRPAHTVNATIGYQVCKPLFISVSGKYVSRRRDIGGYKRPDVALEAYTLVNAYAEYKLKDHLKFFVDAQNIANKKFFDIRGYNAIPFLVNGGVTFNW
jgi:vitamin B12 transporter